MFHDAMLLDTKMLRKLVPVKSLDIFTAGFPCQPFSAQGVGQGVQDASGRGSIETNDNNTLCNQFPPRPLSAGSPEPLPHHVLACSFLASSSGTVGYKAIEIIKALQPKSFVLENVEGLVKRHRATFDEILKILEDIPTHRGSRKKLYLIKWAIKNSTDCGTPQNRPRLHIVGIHRDLVDQSIADKIFSWPAKPLKSLNTFLTKGLPAADVTAMNFTRLRNLHEIKAKYGKRASAASQEILIGDLDASPGRGINVGTIIMIIGCRSVFFWEW